MGGHLADHSDSASFSNLVFFQSSSTSLRPRHINLKEMAPILIAIREWLNLNREAHLIIYNDKLRSFMRLGEQIYGWFCDDPHARDCMLLTANGIIIESQWSLTKETILSDLLSRGK